MPHSFSSELIVLRTEKKENHSFDHICVTPTVEALADTRLFFAFLKSHKWTVDKAEAYATNGILNKIHCENCGIERTAVVTEIRESEMRARVFRRKLAETTNAKKANPSSQSASILSSDIQDGHPSPHGDLTKLRNATSSKSRESTKRLTRASSQP